MAEWIRSSLDIVLILLVGAGLIQAMRLLKSLSDLRSGRVEMERFVFDFNAAVVRAENGIRGLRQAARESGDDLEKLVEKSVLVRDELQYLVESADQIAGRLSTAATEAKRPETKPSEPRVAEAPKVDSSASQPVAQFPPRKPEAPATPPPSRAEKELMQALQKLN